MNRFISIVIITILFFFSNHCSNCQRKNGELVLEADLRGCYFFQCREYSPPNCDSLEYYLLDVKLINNSDKEVEFLTHNNTPIVNLILTSDEFKIVGNVYINNSSSTIRLPPGKEFSFPLILESKRKRKLYRAIKIGWAYLTFENTGNYDNYYNMLERARTKYENVIWSDYLNLEMEMAKPIKIR